MIQDGTWTLRVLLALLLRLPLDYLESQGRLLLVITDAFRSMGSDGLCCVIDVYVRVSCTAPLSVVGKP